MKIFLLIIEIITGAILVGAVLLHSPKGEGLGSIGGQARLFNSQKDLEAGLTKFTGIVAIIFIVLSILLSII